MDIIDKQLLSINHETVLVVKTRFCAQTEIPTVWQNNDEDNFRAFPVQIKPPDRLT